MQNLHMYVPPRKQADGSLAFMLPCSKNTLVPAVDVHDIGGVVVGILNDIGRYNGQTIPIASEWISMEKIASDLAKVLGKAVSFNEITDQTAREIGMTEEFIQMFRAFENVGFFGKDCKNVSFDTTLELFRDIKTWPQYLVRRNAFFFIFKFYSRYLFEFAGEHQSLVHL